MAFIPVAVGSFSVLFGLFCWFCDVFVQPHAADRMMVAGSFIGFGCGLIGIVIGMMGRMIPALILMIGGAWLGLYLGG